MHGVLPWVVLIFNFYLLFIYSLLSTSSLSIRSYQYSIACREVSSYHGFQLIPSNCGNKKASHSRLQGRHLSLSRPFSLHLRLYQGKQIPRLPNSKFHRLFPCSTLILYLTVSQVTKEQEKKKEKKKRRKDRKIEIGNGGCLLLKLLHLSSLHPTSVLCLMVEDASPPSRRYVMIQLFSISSCNFSSKG